MHDVISQGTRRCSALLCVGCGALAMIVAACGANPVEQLYHNLNDHPSPIVDRVSYEPKTLLPPDDEHIDVYLKPGLSMSVVRAYWCDTVVSTAGQDLAYNYVWLSNVADHEADDVLDYIPLNTCG